MKDAEAGDGLLGGLFVAGLVIYALVFLGDQLFS